MKGFTGAIFLILYFFIGFSGQATEPLVLSTNKEEKITPLAKQLDEAPTLILSVKNGGEQSACSDCTLSNLLKKPYLFFKSLGPNQPSEVTYLLKNQPLSVEIFGAYSTDKDEGSWQRAGNPLGNEDPKILGWKGSASYHIIQIPSYNVFLKGGIRLDSATHLRNPLQTDQDFLSLPSSNAADHFRQELDQEYLTYTMGLRFEKDKDIFLDLSAFETSIANPSEDDFQILYFKPVDPKQPSDIQGMEVQAGFLFRSWHGSAQYVYTRSDDLYFEDSQFLNHLGTVRLGYSPTAKLILGTALVRRGEDLFDSERSMEVLDIYSFYDVHERARLGVIMQNVTNEPYGYYERDSLFDRGERTLLLRLEISSKK